MALPRADIRFIISMIAAVALLGAGMIWRDASLLALGAGALGVPALMTGGQSNAQRSGTAPGSGIPDEPDVGVEPDQDTMEDDDTF